MGQEQPPQILWRKRVAMGLTQPWCQHLGHPAPVPPMDWYCGRCDSSKLRQRWLCNKETMTATEEKSRGQVKGGSG